MVGEIRGQGLIGAVEFVASKDPPIAFDPALTVAGRVVKAAFAKGVISRALPSSDSVAFSPPFVISEREIRTVVSTMREAADDVMEQLERDGHFKR